MGKSALIPSTRVPVTVSIIVPESLADVAENVTAGDPVNAIEHDVQVPVVIAYEYV